MTHAALNKFRNSLTAADPVQHLRNGLIGDGIKIDGPFGEKELIYADYVASGRAIRQVEEFILEHVLPYYANSHTEASFCGSAMTRLREGARAEIAKLCGASDDYETVFCGSGATAGLNRLVHLLGISEDVAGGDAPLVLIGPYEHHSNILPWRESGVEIIEISESEEGGLDLVELEQVLENAEVGRLVVGSFSVMSNVTGIVTDEVTVTRLLKKYGALSVWDCAGSGPYLPINMKAGTDSQIDAIVVSPHKFIGGPAASGVMIVRKDVVRFQKPVFSGGGTVRFVSPWAHDYVEDIATREEAGTPNVIGDIRAALAFLVKEAIGQREISSKNELMRQQALSVWKNNPAIEILGNANARHKMPIFSFRVRDLEDGGYIHQQLITRMLSDVYGIQARGGCACAGPYAHNLLNIDQDQSEILRARILSGEELEKPGWTRLNFSVLMSADKIKYIIDSVNELAANPYNFAKYYECSSDTARFNAIQKVA